MKWRTKISVHKDGTLYIRGHKLLDLIGKYSFSEAVFLMLRGAFPEKYEEEILNTILVASIEHGIEAPSTFVTRTVASTGNSFNTALSAGILTMGSWHGGAIEGTARNLQSNKTPEAIVSYVLEKKEKLPGYGHKLYEVEDPRTTIIFKRAKELGCYGKYIARAYALQEELKRQTGKKLVINIDGAIAAIISELGFDWRIGKFFFILGRLPGLAAHLYEEMVDEKPYRRLDTKDIEYEGPSLKD
ncbi:citryl-CoA lyase [Patescibacteria group bacterium AH-259-L07]|nr:citryl-CoA lyase [Patescibacteria group bacterium AH-259-L07]